MDCFKNFKTQCLFRLDENNRMLQKALDNLDEAAIWKQPNTHLNSIGNLIVHLCGNMTQYGIAALNGLPDLRNRDAEFINSGTLKKSDLLQELFDTVQRVKDTITHLPPEKLSKSYTIQGFQMPGLGAILHVVEHYSYHTGQIAFWVKYLKDMDLGFYDGIDLNAKNN